MIAPYFLTLIISRPPSKVRLMILKVETKKSFLFSLFESLRHSCQAGVRLITVETECHQNRCRCRSVGVGVAPRVQCAVCIKRLGCNRPHLTRADNL